MSDTPSSIDYLKSREAIIIIVATVVVAIIVVVAVILPQQSKVSTLHNTQATLEEQVAKGNAQVDALKHEAQTGTKLQGELTKLTNFILSSPTEIYNYLKLLEQTVTASGAKLTSIAPSVSAASKNGKSTSPVSGLTPITVSLAVTAPYDDLLKLITNIYKLTRLTLINTVTTSGGGAGTNRSTPLTATLVLQAFTSVPPTTVK